MKVLCLVLLAASAAVTDARPSAKAQYGGYPGTYFLFLDHIISHICSRS